MSLTQNPLVVWFEANKWSESRVTYRDTSLVVGPPKHIITIWGLWTHASCACDGAVSIWMKEFITYPLQIWGIIKPEVGLSSFYRPYIPSSVLGSSSATNVAVQH